MSEAIIQADIQRELLRLTSTFSAGDVTISDWGVLDGSSANAPYVIIDASGPFSLTRVQSQWIQVWNIPFALVVKFLDWDVSRADLAAKRETVLAALRDTKNYNSASIALAWGLREIGGAEISPVYDRYATNPSESLPVFLSQEMTATVEEMP